MENFLIWVHILCSRIGSLYHKLSENYIRVYTFLTKSTELSCKIDLFLCGISIKTTEIPMFTLETEGGMEYNISARLKKCPTGY